MEDIYDLFRWVSKRDFPSNLDALEDVLSDMSYQVYIDDISHFRTIFDSKMTEKYFWEKYDQSILPLSEILIEIFQETH